MSIKAPFGAFFVGDVYFINPQWYDSAPFG
jgi:hypothetical protein